MTSVFGLASRFGPGVLMRLVDAGSTGRKNRSSSDE
jgi:hypothetical protein